MKQVKKNKKKSFVIGLIEMKQMSLRAIYECIDLEVKELKEYTLKMKPDVDKIAKERKVTNGFSLNLFGRKFGFNQLINLKDFESAGEELDNCILGHFNHYVSTNELGERVRDITYYRLVWNNKVSNLMINNGWINQHYNYKNTHVSTIERFFGLWIAKKYAQTSQTKETANKAYYKFLKELDVNPRKLVANELFAFINKKLFANQFVMQKFLKIKKLEEESIDKMNHIDDIPF